MCSSEYTVVYPAIVLLSSRLFVLPALIRKQHTAELHLGDFLVFLRRVVSSKAIQSKMASPKWTEVLLNIAAQKCCSGTTQLKSSTSFLINKCCNSGCLVFAGVPLVGNLRTRLLALHVLEAVLPACEANMEDDQMTQVQHWFFIGVQQTGVSRSAHLVFGFPGCGAAVLPAVGLHVGSSGCSGQTLDPD